ncbi:hypothetical protein [Pandoraea apista]|uniref:hypothetical protein n=1 Tax=Pandoraea apista TaxID=93218 RepID=UPI000F661A17|nr:hypothetical protein [Pandoraea apista]RRW90619.1 hypothetical protein EGJ54_21960 [Pandoraea apista]
MHYFDTDFIRDITVSALESRKAGEFVRDIIEECIEATIRADNRLREVTPPLSTFAQALDAVVGDTPHQPEQR